MALLRFNDNVVLLFILLLLSFSLARSLVLSLIYSHLFRFLCNLSVSFSLCLFIWTNIFKNLFVERQRVACVPLYLFLSACLRACVFVIHLENRNYILVIRAYADMRMRVSRLFCAQNAQRATPDQCQLTHSRSLLEMLLDFDLCAVFMHVYKLIFNR